jgi:hypothetical protein
MQLLPEADSSIFHKSVLVNRHIESIDSICQAREDLRGV